MPLKTIRAWPHSILSASNLNPVAVEGQYSKRICGTVRRRIQSLRGEVPGSATEADNGHDQEHGSDVQEPSWPPAPSQDGSLWRSRSLLSDLGCSHLHSSCGASCVALVGPSSGRIDQHVLHVHRSVAPTDGPSGFDTISAKPWTDLSTTSCSQNPRFGSLFRGDLTRTRSFVCET